MVPRSSSSPTVRSTVAIGIVTGVPRASPEVLMPSTRPAASMRGPPENPSYIDTSRRSSESISPPRQVRHAPATLLTTPQLAVSRGPGRPSAITNSPTQGDGCAGAVRQGYGDVVVALDGVVGRDDYSLAPVNAARGNAAPGVDRHDGAAARLDGAGELVR